MAITLKKGAKSSGKDGKKSAKPKKLEESSIKENLLSQIQPDKPEKAKKAKEKAIDANSVEIIGKVAYDKALKWKYPEDITEQKQRKIFRAKMRSRIKSLTANITTAPDAKAAEKLQKELAKLKREVLMDPTK